MCGSGLAKSGWLLRSGAGWFLLAALVQPARADCFHPGERWSDASSRLAPEAAVRGPIKFVAVSSKPAVPLESNTPAAPPRERKRCPAGFQCGPPTQPGAPPPAPTAPERLDLLALIDQHVASLAAAGLWPTADSLYSLDLICRIEDPPRSV